MQINKIPIKKSILFFFPWKCKVDLVLTLKTQQQEPNVKAGETVLLLKEC